MHSNVIFSRPDLLGIDGESRTNFPEIFLKVFFRLAPSLVSTGFPNIQVGHLKQIIYIELNMKISVRRDCHMAVSPINSHGCTS